MSIPSDDLQRLMGAIADSLDARRSRPAGGSSDRGSTDPSSLSGRKRNCAPVGNHRAGGTYQRQPSRAAIAGFLLTPHRLGRSEGSEIGSAAPLSASGGDRDQVPRIDPPVRVRYAPAATP
jgi:hypothetical protein